MIMDMDVRKSFELQSQVRHNAQEFKTTVNELYNWQKDIKDQERDLLKSPPVHVDEEVKPTLVRSHAHMPKKNKELPEEIAKKQNECKSGKLQQQDEKFEEPLDINEEKRMRANAFKDVGNKFVKIGEFEKAIVEYTAAIEIFPEDPVFYSNRALCYLRLERYAECIEDCDQAIEIDSLSVKAFYRRMQANESLGNNLDALKDCTTVLMIEPKNIQGQTSLNRINDRMKKYAKSENGPNFSELRDNMIDILPIIKPTYKRSTKPLKRIPITEVVLPKITSDNLKISDEDIDRLFNSNCGPFVEVKPTSSTKRTSQGNVKPTVGYIQDEKKANTSIHENNKKKVDTSNVCKSTAIPTTNMNIKEDTRSEFTSMSTEEGWHTPPMEPLELDTFKYANEVENDLEKQMQSSENVDKEKQPNTKKENCGELPPPPITTHQFYSTWKELNSIQKYQYLKSIHLSKLCKLLGAGFNPEILTDIINIVHDYYLPNGDASYGETLFEVSKNNQMCILSLLMSQSEKEALLSVVKKLKETPDDRNNKLANSIIKNYNL